MSGYLGQSGDGPCNFTDTSPEVRENLVATRLQTAIEQLSRLANLQTRGWVAKEADLDVSQHPLLDVINLPTGAEVPAEHRDALNELSCRALAASEFCTAAALAALAGINSVRLMDFYQQ